MATVITFQICLVLAATCSTMVSATFGLSSYKLGHGVKGAHFGLLRTLGHYGHPPNGYHYRRVPYGLPASRIVAPGFAPIAARIAVPAVPSYAASYQTYAGGYAANRLAYSPQYYPAAATAIPAIIPRYYSAAATPAIIPRYYSAAATPAIIPRYYSAAATPAIIPRYYSAAATPAIIPRYYSAAATPNVIPQYYSGAAALPISTAALADC